MNGNSRTPLSPEDVAAAIDHTALKPATTEAEIRQLCSEALHYKFASVCVNPTWVALAAELLADSPVRVCTVIGFPLGATLSAVKAFETGATIAAGAQEVDMVINIGRLKDAQYDAVRDDIRGVVNAAHSGGGRSRPVVVKVIIETALLTDFEKRMACILAAEAGADFVKTSTGFSGGGATVEDIRLMRQVVGPQMGVKASGGIRNGASSLALLEAGATRLGVSAGVTIVQELIGKQTSQPMAAGGAY
ncbi:MAG: deoxyribose-phosphate aldolase [Caldilineaceae bacterium]|nr:deoxyribose-phosphate aldolase [Caldilineaceae bacterium]HRJ44888.1 deoxyribose-phosphate aldolase [Caldilineaceae bacterium]